MIMSMMSRKLLLACASLLLAGSALAQPGPGTGGGMGGGMGQGPCMKGDVATGPNCGWRMSRKNTPGYRLMTPEERASHQQKMRAFTNRDECQAYMAEHHAEMATRAKAKGMSVPAPRGGACNRLAPATR
jgi:hypothetical protein